MENLHPFNSSLAATFMARPVGPFYFPTQQFGFSQQLFPAGVWPQTLSTTSPLCYLPHWMIPQPQQMQPPQMQTQQPQPQQQMQTQQMQTQQMQTQQQMQMQQMQTQQMQTQQQQMQQQQMQMQQMQMQQPPQMQMQQPQQMQPPLPAREKFKTFRQRTGVTARKGDEEYVPRLANRQKEIVDEEWQKNFTALKKFQTAECRLPMNNDKIDGFKISEWVQEMRNTRHWLSRDRVENLETVQGWTWEVRYVPFPSGKWDDWHNILQQFVEAFKYLPRYKNQWETRDGDVIMVWRIGVWCSNQRQARLDGGLTEEQIAALDAVPRWEWELDDWNKKIVWFTDHVNANGFPARETVVPNPETNSEWKIGRWMNRQRLRRREGLLTANQIELFELIPGWEWDVVCTTVTRRKQMAWDDWVVLLCEYMALNENKMPSSVTVYVKNDKKYNLGQWVYNQKRRKHAKGRNAMPQERIDKLEAVPGWKW
jgi:hypothetical protein